ncbi:tRNA uridine-5-carboxymethylaminomethyl(34) synthesis GTPase MnmE [Aestuariirhabdus sp. Z084]|uniref:tRNA uridine-5-carboxymethylaminomethyl(34) synthesis GTPase MnmE n=1 Tax=Aestuariirhabdus haliotis TaxID=2918751 RepID=UPI00201B44AF|nr:tRNA uridine-5-carboxymethylaminomethyl(34) synthesis GTPase MnmE [Aestuariirhabdus haliotis]MCL6414234.1 tRNA uridine-5-carboxymethylaminomethyl(34) synthesis GTPase MnmE [Aestuariirhabdus haliotis]MCL6418166.1 tRNA uridine-5-carboxymethylaminomethyl(34) synthesis GTPase MnmE [Aestuariirhabdus haliotis]
MTSHTNKTETIAAIATAPGRGGVGIVRVSGPQAKPIAKKVCGKPLKARHAHYGSFENENNEVIDQGIALLFEGPNSFTGEDVLELQAHGGPVILDLLLRAVLTIGARQARPGEFSERAFLNDKIDLTQAEAIADLIDSSSEQAARSALNSLQGDFSRLINELVEGLIRLRIYVEAAIDFPEEEIDFLADGKVANDLQALQSELDSIRRKAGQGAILREGMTVVIAGRPNAGKSSLLNALSGKDSAIVTNIAGTTRDLLREQIHIDGMPLHIVDTAGLRDSDDAVEQIGVSRALAEIEKADRVLLMVDATTTSETRAEAIWPEFIDMLPDPGKLTLIRNKIDQSGEQAGIEALGETSLIRLCATNQQGVEALRQHLKQCMGFEGTTEGSFMARRRHLEALRQAQQCLDNGKLQLESLGAGELLAEDLRAAQHALGEITGSFSSNDLLGRIFSSFCIGK